MNAPQVPRACYASVAAAGCVGLYLWQPSILFYFIGCTMVAVAVSLWVLLLPTSPALYDGITRHAGLLVAGLIGLFCVTFAILAILKFNAHAMGMFDLGNMDQAVWNTSRGRLLMATRQDPPYATMSRLAVHVELIYVVLALFYRLWDDPRLLLSLQVLAAGAGLWACWAIARHTLAGRLHALCCLLLCLLHPSLQFMLIYDVHGDVFAVPFLLWAIFFQQKKRALAFWLCIAGALLCKEYVALAVIGYGVLLALDPASRRTGFLLFGTGAAWFVICMYLIIPAFNQGAESPVIAQNFAAIGGGGGLLSMAGYLLTHPAALLGRLCTGSNLGGILYLLFPLFFLPLRAPFFLLGGTLIFAKDFLFGFDISLHHLAPALPFLFMACINAVASFERKGGERMCSFICMSALLCALLAAHLYGPSPLGQHFHRMDRYYTVYPNDVAIRRAVSRVPEMEPVAASGLIAPHLTHRMALYEFPRPFDMPPPARPAVTWVCIDTLEKNSRLPDHNGQQTLAALQDMGYQTIFSERSVWLFRRKM